MSSHALASATYHQKRSQRNEQTSSAISASRNFHATTSVPRGGVFYITADDSVEDEDAITNEDLRISMHALTGVTASDTIFFHIKINGVELKAPVDSGSTHTFIHDGVA
jgi:hypothetical protein